MGILVNLLVIVCLASCLPVSPFSPVVLLCPAASTCVTRYAHTYIRTYTRVLWYMYSTGHPSLGVALPALVLHSRVMSFCCHLCFLLTFNVCRFVTRDHVETAPNLVLELAHVASQVCVCVCSNIGINR